MKILTGNKFIEVDYNLDSFFDEIKVIIFRCHKYYSFFI